jgi:hypothetical protein
MGGSVENEPGKCKNVILKIAVPVLAVFLGAFLQGKIDIFHLNLTITIAGAIFYAITGGAYLVLFIMDGQRRMCNLHYATIGFMFSGLTVCWIIFAQCQHRLPEILDFIYGWANMYLFGILIQKPIALIRKIKQEKQERKNGIQGR